jgi:hypothetical protein
MDAHQDATRYLVHEPFRRDDAGKRSAMKVACCVWRGAFGTGLLQQYLAGCLPYINETVMRYCEAEHLTFTRGRPEVKNDQCFVEQKNGAVVRHFVGNARLVGSQAARQLRELYRGLRLYVNCFQPSMKLLSKQGEEGNVRRVYDPAKTPLQRLLLAGILPEATQDHLREVAQALDPIRLLHQVEQLQQAARRGVVTPFALIPTASPTAIVLFCVQHCLPEGFLPEEQGTAAASVRPWLQDDLHPEMEMPDWSRTMREPFEGEWDLILSLVLVHRNVLSGNPTVSTRGGKKGCPQAVPPA